MKYLKALFKDLLDQSWTLRMAVAWLVLEGSARDVTGMLDSYYPVRLDFDFPSALGQVRVK